MPKHDQTTKAINC